MNPRRRLRNLTLSLCALALLCAAAGATAQTTIYKQVDATGKITFTDRPDSNLPAQLIASSGLTSPVLEAPKPPARAVLMTSRRSITIDANEATRRLTQAQLMRSEGADLRPGDWTHGSAEEVPNQRYWQRQVRLRVQVEQAQQRANETHRSLLALN